MTHSYPSPLTQSLEAQLQRLYRRRRALDNLIESLVAYRETDIKAPVKAIRPARPERLRGERLAS